MGREGAGILAIPARPLITSLAIKAVKLQEDDFHPEWNYSIRPSATS